MDIEGLGEMMVTQLVKAQPGPGCRRYLLARFRRNFPRLERTGEKSIRNLLDAIERSKTRPLWRLIYGLGILHVGETSSRELAAHFQSVEALMNASAEELQRIPDVGEVVGASIHQFFQEPHNRDLIARLKKAGLKPTVEPRKTSDSAIAGTTWVITGTLSQPRDEIAEMIISAAEK